MNKFFAAVCIAIIALASGCADEETAPQKTQTETEHYSAPAQQGVGCVIALDPEGNPLCVNSECIDRYPTLEVCQIVHKETSEKDIDYVKLIEGYEKKNLQSTVKTNMGARQVLRAFPIKNIHFSMKNIQFWIIAKK